MKEKKYKGISRIDQIEKKTHGWYLRIRHQGVMRSKFFSDNKHHGREAALQAAIVYRNVLEKNLGIPRTDRYLVTKRSDNKSGVIGVQRKVKKYQASNGDCIHWNIFEITYNPEPGVTKKTSVSINLYGEQEAFRRACLIRQRKEREIYGVPIQNMSHV